MEDVPNPKQFQPLSDLWELYTDSLDEAVTRGYINDDNLAENYVWPTDLQMGEKEKEDVKKYVHERMLEVVERIKRDQGLDPNLVASYIFRSVLCGLMWQRERIGK